MNKLIRSLLFVPGSRPERFAKAQNAGADLICIDLEDAVLPQDKDTARQAVVDFISEGNKQLCVRINHIESDEGVTDLTALAAVNPAYIMLPKCTNVSEIITANDILAKIDTKIIALIETPVGVDNAADIASDDRVIALMLGGADMSAELGCEFSYEPLLFVRSQLVFAAAKAGVELIDVPYIDIQNESGLIEETTKVKALGYTAKAAIHPTQINAIHQAFMPTEQQIEYAQQVLTVVDGPDAGVVVVNGRMVDRPIILSCQRIMVLANAGNQS